MPEHQSSPEYILFNQLSGIQEALRHIIAHKSEIGASTITHLRKLRDYFEKCASNEPLSILPTIDEKSTPGDLLILASVMQYSLQTLLTKEEKESLINSCAKWVGLASKAKELII